MSGYLNNFEQQISTLNSVYYELLAPIEKQSTLKNCGFLVVALL
ncbi:hypothetical protein [Aliarcobacter cryaerophilus]|nr:hypothetical protein [Aliarcobacter cryaerophilus]